MTTSAETLMNYYLGVAILYSFVLLCVLIYAATLSGLLYALADDPLYYYDLRVRNYQIELKTVADTRRESANGMDILLRGLLFYLFVSTVQYWTAYVESGVVERDDCQSVLWSMWLFYVLLTVVGHYLVLSPFLYLQRSVARAHTFFIALSHLALLFAVLTPGAPSNMARSFWILWAVIFAFFSMIPLWIRVYQPPSRPAVLSTWGMALALFAFYTFWAVRTISLLYEPYTYNVSESRTTGSFVRTSFDLVAVIVVIVLRSVFISPRIETVGRVNIDLFDVPEPMGGYDPNQGDALMPGANVGASTSITSGGSHQAATYMRRTFQQMQASMVSGGSRPPKDPGSVSPPVSSHGGGGERDKELLLQDLQRQKTAYRNRAMQLAGSANRLRRRPGATRRGQAPLTVPSLTAGVMLRVPNDFTSEGMANLSSMVNKVAKQQQRVARVVGRTTGNE